MHFEVPYDRAPLEYQYTAIVSGDADLMETLK